MASGIEGSKNQGLSQWCQCRRSVKLAPIGYNEKYSVQAELMRSPTCKWLYSATDQIALLNMLTASVMVTKDILKWQIDSSKCENDELVQYLFLETR